jgi:hypothetical protein
MAPARFVPVAGLTDFGLTFFERTHSVTCGAHGGPSVGTAVQALLPVPIR